jgi:hypothetical protein
VRQGVLDADADPFVHGVEVGLPGGKLAAVSGLADGMITPVPWYPPSAITLAPAHCRSTPDSV